MSKNRMEAFSDNVLSIIITIMILNFSVPHNADFESLRRLLPPFLSYLLSFLFLGIYWSNHHHLLQSIQHVDGRVLWANLHLLFWLSLTPFVTGWIGASHFAALPVALYGSVLLVAAIAYLILTRALISLHGRESVLGIAMGRDFKGKISIVFYAVAIPLAFFGPLFSCSLYVLVAIMWLVPDRRLERVLKE
jgi:uncharacterized membrane protein